MPGTQKRPTIGVTGPDRGGLMAWLMTALAISRAGARAVRITPSRPVDNGDLQALVVGGGTDVDPFHYGEDSQRDIDAGTQHSSLLDWLVGLLLGLFRMLFASHDRQGYDPERDRMEKALIQYALRHQLPVLGICRGAQLMNVVRGGTLHQAIGHFYTEDTANVRSILPRKSVTVSGDSHLYQMLGKNTCRVNALHNQSINQLGADIVVSAREPSGVVQAIEKGDHRFFIGVQWHPEYMPQSKTQQALFRGLVHSTRLNQAADAGPDNA